MEDSSKKKYDRQLRIWGEHGQANLLSSKICLLKCGPTGSETLKNLVLGGIHSFTIVDDARVTPSDLGNNFMLDTGSLGRPIAMCVTELLKEMAGDVAGSFVEESPETLLEANPAFFEDFTLVIATQMPEAYAAKLDAQCRSIGVPMVWVRSYGLMGTLRVSVAEHTVIESKPDNIMDDLRVHRPWPELLDFAKSFDLTDPDDMIHKHIPMVAILIQVLEKWRAGTGAEAPRTAQERRDFKALVQGACRMMDVSQADNFKEAVAKAHVTWAPPAMGDGVRAVIEDAKAVDLAVPAAAGPAGAGGRVDFWVLAGALRRFVDTHGGVLPLDGAVPDMTATTEWYLAVQKVYGEKAARDVGEVESYAQQLLKDMGRDPSSLPRGAVKHFCKHARHLKVVRCRSIAEETGEGSCKGEEVKKALESEDQAANMSLYMLLRAADRFAATYGHVPGADAAQLEEDSERLKSTALGLMGECRANTSAELSDDYLAEICRFGASELHAVAALMGGMAAQEAIKLITHQFVPLTGTLVYNGMASSMSVFNL